MNLKIISFSLITIWSTIFLLPSHTFAIPIFFDGKPTVLTDINQITDDFFAGSNSSVGPQKVESTSLMFIVNRLRENQTGNIYGGGQAIIQNQNIVIENTNLDINNTVVEGIYGGGNPNGGSIVIGGSVNMRLKNVNTTGGIYGGSKSAIAGGTSSIKGSVNMFLDNVRTFGTVIEGAGEVSNTDPRQLAVQKNVNITMVNSFANGLSLASQKSNTSNVGGNAILVAYNSRINILDGAGRSQIFGDLTMTLDNCRVVLVRPSAGGHVHGSSTINIFNSNIENLAPPLTGLLLPMPLFDINIDNSTIDNIIAGSEQGTIEKVNLTVKDSNVASIVVGAFIGVTKNAFATITSSMVNQLRLGSIGNGVTNLIGAKVNNSTVRDLFVGSGANGFTDKITTDINNSTVRDLFVGSTNYGFTNSATANINNSKVQNLIVGSIDYGSTNSATANITDSTVQNLLVGSADYGFTNSAILNLNNSMASDITVGAADNGRTAEATLNISGKSMVSNISVGSVANGYTDMSTVNMHDGMVQQLALGALDQATVLLSTANISGGTIGKLLVGNNGNTQVATANISGGWTDTIDVQGNGYKIINFSAGKRSNINNSFQGLPPDLVNVQKDARTQWGSTNKDFFLTTNGLIWSGTILTPHIEEAGLTINNLFVADGGSFVPRELNLQKIAPVLHLEGPPQSMLIINKQLNINLSLSPKLIGVDLYPIATVSPSFASPELFAKETKTGLIWSELLFDPSTNIWFLTNVRPSRDFYAFSTARESSNWLRQQHIYGLQSRANKVLKNGKDGLWIDLQGGFEKLATSFGKDSKMPWAMASMGYDFLQKIPSVKLKALYGFAFGVNAGKSKWKYYHTAKNDIQTGMVAGYLGLIHNSGIYATATVQLASNKIHTRTKGFNRSFKWTESTPTEAFELGWQYLFTNGFSLNPRGQIILEQSSSHRFRLPYRNDHAILDKSFLTTTAVGLAGTYELQQLPLNIEASVDWFKGLSGDFAVKSRTLKMKFKHDNNTSLVRTALGLNTQLGEHFTLYGNVFMDLGNDKGIGGQIKANYKF